MTKTKGSKMQTDITKTTVGELIDFGTTWDFGATPDASDIQIPKLMLMQPLSDLVTTGKAKSGDIVNSLEGNVVSSESVDVIVFDSYKTVQTFIDGEYEKTEAWNTEIGNLPYEETLQGKKINRTHVLNFYVLLKSEIATDTAFPFVVSFKRTSMQTGRKLMTLITKMRMFKKPSCAAVFRLGRTLEKNDKGSYYVWTIDQKESATMNDVVAAKLWVDQLKTKKAVVDDKDI